MHTSFSDVSLHVVILMDANSTFNWRIQGAALVEISFTFMQFLEKNCQISFEVEVGAS